MFSSFENLNGYFKQRSGLSMGGRLSPSLANIYLHMMEKQIIKRYIDQGIIISYQRYCDDCACVFKKGYKHEILNKMNKFDSELQWTRGIP